MRGARDQHAFSLANRQAGARGFIAAISGTFWSIGVTQTHQARALFIGRLAHLERLFGRRDSLVHFCFHR